MNDAAAPTAPPAPGRARRNRGSEQVRGRLIESAIAEFAAHGFAGASTRAIAEGADAHQSQIKYHFASKDELWRRCLEALIDELEGRVAEQDGIDSGVPRHIFEATVRGLVEFAAARPELSRIMMHEATTPSERLRWLVESRTGQRYDELKAAWADLVAAGEATPLDPELVYHTMVGAASLVYANAPEARLMGLEPRDPEVVARHADGLIAMFLPPHD